MGIEYSTKNYSVIGNMVDKKPLYLCSIDINDYLNLEEVSSYLIYKNNTDDHFLFYYGPIFNISDYTRINEELLVNKSKKYNNLLELMSYVKTDIKDPTLITILEDYQLINIKPDMNYLSQLV